MSDHVLENAVTPESTGHEKNWRELLYPILDVLLNGANYAFFVILARSMSLSALRASNSTLSIIAVLSVAGIGIQTAAARRAAANPAARIDGESAGDFLSYLIIVALVPLQFLLPENARIISFGGVTLLLLLMVHLRLSFIRGILQGRRDFLSLNISFYIEVFTKLATYLAIFAFMKSGRLAPEIMLSAILLGYIVSYAHARTLVSGNSGMEQSMSGAAKAQHIGKREVLGFMFSNILVYLFLSGDYPVFALRFPGEAGLYAVVQKFGQLLFFVFSSVSIVFLPRFSAANTAKIFAQEMKRNLAIWIALTAIALPGFALILPIFVPMIFGSNFSKSAIFLVPAWLLYSQVGLSLIFSTAFQALGSRKHFYPMIAGYICAMIFILGGATNLVPALYGESIAFAAMNIALAIMLTQEVQREYNKK